MFPEAPWKQLEGAMYWKKKKKSEKMIVPWAGIEPRSLGWETGVLPTRPAKHLLCRALIDLYLWKSTTMKQTYFSSLR